MPNLEIQYLYRDASNNKNRASVVITNRDYLPVHTVYQRLKGHFAEQQCWPDIVHIQPEQLGWPTAYFEDYDPEDDLDLHELEEIQDTMAPCTHEFDASQLNSS